MNAYRLSPTEFADDLSGNGAAKLAGRWNKPGTPCLYASGSRALALCECLLGASGDEKPDDLSFVIYDIPDDLPTVELSEDDLPGHWPQNPPPPECQQIGNQYLETTGYVAIRVPSSIVPDEYNYVLNPTANGFDRVRIVTIKAMDMGQITVTN